MDDKKTKRLSRRQFLGVTAAAVATLALPGCGNDDANASSNSNSANSSAANSDGSSKKITIAYVQGGYPTSFTDDTGEPDGYEIQVLKKVSEILSDYEFEYVGLDQPAVFAGLSTGRYDLGLTNSFWTPERAESYLQPKEHVGATILGFVIRKEHDGIDTLGQAAEAGLSLAPITAGDGNYYVVSDYNDQHPDQPIELVATEDGNAFTEAFTWVHEGRYDFTVVPLQYWNGLVVEEDGAFHSYEDDLRFSIIGGAKTWSFLANGREEFETDYSAALKQLKDEGALSELSTEWYGIDNFEYITDETSNYSYL